MALEKACIIVHLYPLRPNSTDGEKYVKIFRTKHVPF